MSELALASEPDLFVSALVGSHLALAPVAFAVTAGEHHAIVYANSLFRNMQSTGELQIGAAAERSSGQHIGAGDLKPLLDDALRTSKTVRDKLLKPPDGGLPRLSCTIWPVSEAADPLKRLVVEVRNVELIEGTKERQRAIIAKLLHGAFQEQDVAQEAVDASERAQYLAAATRELSLSLDEAATLDTVRHLVLPRPGTWCIVDVIESNGALHRLAVVHPDPAKQALARQLEQQWPKQSTDAAAAMEATLVDEPTIVTADAGARLLRIAHSEESLRVLRQIGFGSLLIVPLIVRARVQGEIIFVSRAGDPPFTPDETSLAVDLASRCAMALDNARLYHEADVLRQAAEAANQSKSQFLGTMSHELRTPLNAIGGFAELIEMGIQGPVTEEQRFALARIKTNQQHLLMLINEILNFVRLESGRMEYHLRPISIAQAIADVVAMLGAVATQKQLGLTSVPCAASVMTCADADRVRQILLNLVMNAVKFTANGGTITVSCRTHDDVVAVRVADTGPGIPAERFESIFEPFVQVVKERLSDNRTGIGLGLAISRDLARAMKGDITLESKVGVGSCFTLTLPRA